MRFALIVHEMHRYVRRLDAEIFIEYSQNMPRKLPPETPLYVKLPQNAVDKLHRAAEESGLPKKDIVAGLLTKYLEPVQASATVGSYSFRPYDPPEIMNAEQA